MASVAVWILRWHFRSTSFSLFGCFLFSGWLRSQARMELPKWGSAIARNTSITAALTSAGRLPEAGWHCSLRQQPGQTRCRCRAAQAVFAGTAKPCLTWSDFLRLFDLLLEPLRPFTKRQLIWFEFLLVASRFIQLFKRLAPNVFFVKARADFNRTKACDACPRQNLEVFAGFASTIGKPKTSQSCFSLSRKCRQHPRMSRTFRGGSARRWSRSI